MPARPRRSCLAVPASDAGMVAKAATLPADEVVVDLEDGVAVEHKEAARANLSAARARGTFAVRINGLATQWWRDDLEGALPAQADVGGVPEGGSPARGAGLPEPLPGGGGLAGRH